MFLSQLDSESAFWTRWVEQELVRRCSALQSRQKEQALWASKDA